MTNNEQATALTVGEEDRLRANLYSLLARALAAPADTEFLSLAAGLQGDDSELGRAFVAIAEVARSADPNAVGDEFQDLFIGLGRGELLPYASYYLTGFLNEKPLARLRGTMDDLGIERDPAVNEPEDHIGALMDMMAGLITGAFGAPATIDTQRRFFNDHIGLWAPHFFADLEGAKSARFYQPIGTVGRLFMAIETAAFEM